MVEALSQCHAERDCLFLLLPAMCISVSIKIDALNSDCYYCTEKSCHLSFLLSS